jgi:hypothetical protein
VTTADETWLGRHKPQMRFVPAVFRLGHVRTVLSILPAALSRPIHWPAMLHYANMIRSACPVEFSLHHQPHHIRHSVVRLPSLALARRSPRSSATGANLFLTLVARMARRASFWMLRKSQPWAGRRRHRCAKDCRRHIKIFLPTVLPCESVKTGQEIVFEYPLLMGNRKFVTKQTSRFALLLSERIKVHR